MMKRMTDSSSFVIRHFSLPVSSQDRHPRSDRQDPIEVLQIPVADADGAAVVVAADGLRVAGAVDADAIGQANPRAARRVLRIVGTEFTPSGPL